MYILLPQGFCKYFQRTCRIEVNLLVRIVFACFFQGKDIALVEDENGFSIPMLIRECVVIDTNEYNFEKKTVAPKKEEPKKTAKSTASLRHEDEEEDFEPPVP